MTEAYEDAKTSMPSSIAPQTGVHSQDDGYQARSNDRWDVKLKTLQSEKSQLEQALLQRDAELAALKQKENSLSSGCDK